MINAQILDEAVHEFEEKEGRTNFFALAKHLIESGFEIEGLLLILATWNFAIFRYTVKTFDIENFRKTISALKPNFENFKDQDITSANFDDYENDIKVIYIKLSQIKGIEHTGAPKIMHLKNPELFVMWDGYIRGEKPNKYYMELKVFKDNTWKRKQYAKSFGGYIQFLKDMQTMCKGITFTHPEKSLAKAIDEFNYVNITLPIQEMEKVQKARSKSARLRQK